MNEEQLSGPLSLFHTPLISCSLLLREGPLRGYSGSHAAFISFTWSSWNTWNAPFSFLLSFILSFFQDQIFRLFLCLLAETEAGWLLLLISQERQPGLPPSLPPGREEAASPLDQELQRARKGPAFSSLCSLNAVAVFVLSSLFASYERQAVERYIYILLTNPLAIIYVYDFNFFV